MGKRSRLAGLAAAIATAFVSLWMACGPAIAAQADGGPTLSTAGSALKSDPSVYVSPDVPDSGLTNAEVATLNKQIAKGPHPIYVAILPLSVRSEVDNNPNNLPRDLAAATGLAGVYAVVAGPVFRADSTVSAGVPQAGALASSAYQQHHHQGVYATLSNFVQRVEKLPVAATSVTQSPPFPWGQWILVVVIVVVVIVAIVWLVRRRRNSRKAASDLASAKSGLLDEIEAVEAELSAYNTANPEAQTELRVAINKCGNARTVIDRSKAVDALAPATRMLAGAKAALAEARRLDGAGSTTQPQQEDAMPVWPFRHHDDPDAPRDRRPESSAAPARPASATRTEAAQEAAQARQDLARPTKIVNVTNNYRTGYSGSFGPSCYPGYGLGWYPELNGWGYYGAGDTLLAAAFMVGGEMAYADMMVGYGMAGVYDPFDPFLGGGMVGGGYDPLLGMVVADEVAGEVAADQGYPGDPAVQMTGDPGGGGGWQDDQSTQADTDPGYAGTSDPTAQMDGDPGGGGQWSSDDTSAQGGTDPDYDDQTGPDNSGTDNSGGGGGWDTSGDSGGDDFGGGDSGGGGDGF